MNEIFVPFTPEESKSFRAFRDTKAEVTGKSVVFEKETPGTESFKNNAENFWPQSLADYLKDYAGKNIQIEYILPGGRFSRRQGVIKAVGTNFIGIQPPQSQNLFLVGLESVKSVSILNYQSEIGNRCR